MPYLILFEDAEGYDHIRGEKMPDHLAFLQQNAAVITAAGPLFEGDQGAGGAWIVTTDTAAAAEALVHADPFWPTGLRKSVRILRWKQVFADGSVAG
ncbi:YciI family protein [uncultured Tateyamaria sp.]|uniref:YciI family protein n=1 Tax=uncultured Tateyamaria sp. TaxID=455651 RepID=UPI00260BBF84|nr:YciI family protein [uncultured Tateyamaria sp.]